jgi:hypothetical protein
MPTYKSTKCSDLFRRPKVMQLTKRSELFHRPEVMQSTKRSYLFLRPDIRLPVGNHCKLALWTYELYLLTGIVWTLKLAYTSECLWAKGSVKRGSQLVIQRNRMKEKIVSMTQHKMEGEWRWTEIENKGRIKEKLTIDHYDKPVVIIDLRIVTVYQTFQRHSRSPPSLSRC